MNLRQEFEKSEHCEDLDFAWNDEFNCYADSTVQWIFQFWQDGWQACAERSPLIDLLDIDCNSERNKRVQNRYDELIHEGKHGHYETLFKVVNEEIFRSAIQPVYNAELTERTT